MIIKKGDIVIVNLNPRRGSEYSETRPAVIVSNDVCNTHAPVVTIIPCTSKTDKTYPTQVVFEAQGLPKKSKACGDQIRTVDKSRIEKVVGNVSLEIMRKIEAAIMVHLDIRL